MPPMSPVASASGWSRRTGAAERSRSPDRPAGRRGTLSPAPVAARASAHGLPLLQPARLRDAEALAALRSFAPTLGVLADYGRLVPSEVLAIPPRGFLNVHPSLLP